VNMNGYAVIVQGVTVQGSCRRCRIWIRITAMQGAGGASGTCYNSRYPSEMFALGGTRASSEFSRIVIPFMGIAILQFLTTQSDNLGHRMVLSPMLMSPKFLITQSDHLITSVIFVDDLGIPVIDNFC
jgi:hypothetical protein